MDRKPKFRSRKLEYNRPLQIFKYDDAVDIDDYDNPMRAVPLIATGVDKEEEEVSLEILRSDLIDFIMFRNTIYKLH